MTKPVIKLTCFKSNNSLGKRVFLNEKGEIVKKSGRQFVNKAYTITVESIHELCECHNELSSGNYALGYGIAKNSVSFVPYKICLKAQAQAKDGVVTRTNGDFIWPEYMVIMIDLDSYGEMTPEEQLSKFYEINPEFAKVEHIVRPSCSSYIINTQIEGDEPKVKGYHLYYFCKSCELSQIVEQIWYKAWLAGYGKIVCSRSGALLERSIFDKSVFQSSRMDFIGQAICESPLKQLPIESKIVPGDKSMLLLEDITLLDEKKNC